ncbi:DUF302 domain-containing protein [Cohnella laeviribosi]|uniref:DUF302 domain-containing protein n=1 Tax=Cohnella laeviribosi TaxID=380174 RepID=UPI0003739546|nr:DUF302 domain-containing protein [Cohnella laeviribosi]
MTMHDRENRMVSHARIIREDIPTGLGYEALVAAFEREMGRWDPLVENALIQQKAPWEKVKRVFHSMAGPHGLMIFFHVDQGRLTSLHHGIKRCALYIVGNGIIAEQILSIDVRASQYVPFSVCLYDNGHPGGAIISFDRPSSFLAVFQQPALMEISRLLDSRIYSVVHAIRSKYR